ncbi:chemotaxis protein CheB [Geodermatophilus sp. SYSU D01045]
MDDRQAEQRGAVDVVALVTSAGGLDAVSAVLRELPAELPVAVVVQQHLSGQGSQLVPILRRRADREIDWAENGTFVEPGRVLVTPARRRLEILPDGSCAVGPADLGAIERELGVPLFHGVGRGIVLGDAGAQLIEPARQVVRDLDAARAAARSARGLQRGRVELVAMPSPGIEPLTTLVRAFTTAHPAMTVTADAAFTPEEVVQAVNAGRAELGLLGAASPASGTRCCRRPGPRSPSGRARASGASSPRSCSGSPWSPARPP